MGKPNGNCRVLFCTTAFGMGVDISNVRTVIHFGPTADVDDYFKESGQAEQDGIESNAVPTTIQAVLLDMLVRV